MGERGGAVVAREIFPQNLILVGQTLPSGSNSILRGNRPSVVFGTSGLWNTFEVMVAVKAAASLMAPLVWFNYPSAYGAINQLNLTTYESISLLGLDPFEFDQLFNTKVQVQNALEVQKVLGSWYARANGVVVPIQGFNLEKIIEKTRIMDMRVTDFVEALTSIRGGVFRALNIIQGLSIHAINTNSSLRRLGQMRIRDVHEQGGWLSGAGIHYVLRLLADYGAYIEVMPNLSRGNVYEMYQGVSQNFYGILTGRFHLRAKGQSPEWASVCPLVFLELVRRWGKEKSTAVAQELWQAIKIAPESLKESSFLVTQDGVQRES